MTRRIGLQCEQESEDGEFVLRTINRARLWEIQTPQVRVMPETARVRILSKPQTNEMRVG